MIKVVIDDLISSFKEESGERKVNKLKLQAELTASLIKPFTHEIYKQTTEDKVILANAKLKHKRTHPDFKFQKKLIRFEDLKHFIK